MLFSLVSGRLPLALWLSYRHCSALVSREPLLLTLAVGGGPADSHGNGPWLAAYFVPRSLSVHARWKNKYSSSESYNNGWLVHCSLLNLVSSHGLAIIRVLPFCFSSFSLPYICLCFTTTTLYLQIFRGMEGLHSKINLSLKSSMIP